jgi:hypothetical protein
MNSDSCNGSAEPNDPGRSPSEDSEVDDYNRRHQHGENCASEQLDQTIPDPKTAGEDPQEPAEV